MGGRYKLTSRLSVNVDYATHLNRTASSTFVDPLSVGVDLETGGHVFQSIDKNGDPSLTSQVTRLSGLRPKPDAVMLCSYPPGGTTAIRQIRAGGVDLPLLMNVGMSGYYWLNGVPGLKNAWQDGYVGLRGDDPIAKVNQLTKRYRAKYGEPIKTPIAYAGYQTVQLIAAAIKAAGSTDGKKIAAALVKGKVQILTGPHTFDPDYNVSFVSPAVILKIENGTLKFVTRLAPSKNSKALLTK